MNKHVVQCKIETPPPGDGVDNAIAHEIRRLGRFGLIFVYLFVAVFSSFN